MNSFTNHRLDSENMTWLYNTNSFVIYDDEKEKKRALKKKIKNSNGKGQKKQKHTSIVRNIGGTVE